MEGVYVLQCRRTLVMLHTDRFKVPAKVHQALQVYRHQRYCPTFAGSQLPGYSQIAYLLWA